MKSELLNLSLPLESTDYINIRYIKYIIIIRTNLILRLNTLNILLPSECTCYLIYIIIDYIDIINIKYMIIYHHHQKKLVVLIS